MKTKRSKPGEWVDLYSDLLYRYALTRVRNAEIAEDLVQETFLAALKSHKNFKGESTEKSWMVGILKHKILDYYRKVSKNEELQVISEGGTEKAYFESELRSSPNKEWSLDPHEQLERKELANTLQHCLANIPPKLAEVFTMRELNHMPTEEICKELNLSPTNVWVILHRARARLQNSLELKWLKDRFQKRRKQNELVQPL